MFELRQHVVYLAGAAYSPEEAYGMSAIASLLEGNGFEVYLPSRDGLGPPLCLFEAGQLGRTVLAGVTFALAIFQLAHRCDALVFNMNGRVPDEGGTFEAAAAFALGKPVVLYKRDHRTELHGQDNAMLTGLSHDFSTVKKADGLPGELRKAMERYPRPSGPSAGVPPCVRMTAQLGREVWELLEESRAPGVSTNPKDLPDRLAALHDASSVNGFLSG